ncbi:Superfamily I DNA and/or RNA helicase [Algoriphagus faecimaris]|uniref:Superfamily I DNA and/or RNA helicase n=1 Tax=Algoriphagus faecimaris TaxID=686796 RepID=A0A1G6RVB4_9BACT|nr:AAA domain-containing protein [Algoriphagus faecimaris]SDD08391.1 Superfamily I DNA and/or RNA helicase [Algoriphagus faecimaris]
MPKSIFQTYLHRLTDLSTKNRSLYLPKLEGYGMLDLRELDFLNGEPAFEILRKFISGKKKITIAPEIDPRSSEANQVSKALARLAFRDQLTQEETGDQSLYLAWLFVEGKLMNGQLIRSPLLLKPVQLSKENGNWNLISEENWQLNPTFLLAWRHATGHALPESFSDELLENLPKDPLAFRTALSKLIPEYFTIQIQSNILEDQIIPFPNSQISLDQERFSEGKVSLKPYALLGQFAQKGSFLFSDYEVLMKKLPQASLEDLFEQLFVSEKKETSIREENLFPVFPLDASQESALIKVRQGNSLVIQGPPGTGKSQLIANLITDYIARGKKVLVVSQKRAALDVVYERLEKVGFSPFLGLVHDFRGDQKVLFEKIKTQIEAIEAYQVQNRGIDAIQLERELSLLSKTISRLSGKFEELRTALFDEEPAGIPIKALYLQANLNKSALNEATLLQLDLEQAIQFERDYVIFKAYQDRFSESFWGNRKSFSNIQPSDFVQISSALNSIEDHRKQLPEIFLDEKGKAVLRAVWLDLDFLQKVKKLRLSLEVLSEPEKDFAFIFYPKEKKVIAKIHRFLNQTIEISGGWKFELDENLELLSEELDQLIPLFQNFFGRIKVKFSKSKFPLAFQALVKNNLSFDPKNLLALRQECESKRQVLAEEKKLGLSPFFKSSGQFAEDLNVVEKLLAWKDNWDELPEIHGLMDWEMLSYSAFFDALREIERWMEGVSAHLVSYRLWFSEEQFLALNSKSLERVFPENPLNWPAVFAELKTFDQFLENWKFRELGQRLEVDFPKADLEEQISAFWNGWRLTWIGEIERRSPMLSDLGSLHLVHEMEELKKAILEKRKKSKHLALLRLREQVSEFLEYNRLGNRLTYRDLLHQVSKKRQKWPIRKLITEFRVEILRLLPCWLGSPETVSAVFPTDQIFDLVIFDEASQCPVERGLPAMLRGKQVLVAGDSKQLQPSAFYQVKWESEDEGMAYEAESLLELSAHFFENMQLRGHYRSADPGLIHFSNAHFYGGRLETLPDYATVKAGKTPFSWEKIEGIWENQVNRMEADAVVDRVQRIKELSPQDSIGIVTGNYFQMELIRELLWKAGFQDAAIKVRNIENVQGDEFDQVILSLGYAPNREGKLVTNFGLLGKSGSQNRLNVAITRARRVMHVISSIEAEDFRPSQLANPGLALLREFLAWVKLQSISLDLPPPEVKTSGFEINWSLKNRLMDADISFSKQIPSTVMDLIFSDLEGNKKAILTDDQRFFDAPTAKAAMVYHPILLEEKGWKWEWKWSRFWNSEK